MASVDEEDSMPMTRPQVESPFIAGDPSSVPSARSIVGHPNSFGNGLALTPYFGQAQQSNSAYGRVQTTSANTRPFNPEANSAPSEFRPEQFNVTDRTFSMPSNQVYVAQPSARSTVPAQHIEEPEVSENYPPVPPFQPIQAFFEYTQNRCLYSGNGVPFQLGYLDQEIPQYLFTRENQLVDQRAMLAYIQSRVQEERLREQESNGPNHEFEVPAQNWLADRRIRSVSEVSRPESTSTRPAKRQRMNIRGQAATSRQVSAAPSSSRSQAFVPFADEAAFEQAMKKPAYHIASDCPTDESEKRTWVDAIIAALKTVNSAKKRGSVKHSDRDFEVKAWEIFIKCRDEYHGLNVLSDYGQKKYGTKAEKSDTWSGKMDAVINAIYEQKVAKMMMDVPYLARVVTAPFLESGARKAGNTRQAYQRKLALIRGKIATAQLEQDGNEAERAELQNELNEQREADGEEALTTLRKLQKVNRAISQAEQQLKELRADEARAEASGSASNRQVSQADEDAEEENPDDGEYDAEEYPDDEDDEVAATNATTLAPSRRNLRSTAGYTKVLNRSGHGVRSPEWNDRDELDRRHIHHPHTIEPGDYSGEQDADPSYIPTA